MSMSKTPHSLGLEALLEKVDSKFTLVSLAAKRARQLISHDLGLGEGGGSEVPPQVTSTARKSLSMAFEEIQADKTVMSGLTLKKELA